MDSVLKISIQDLTQQFLRDIGKKFVGATEVEIHIPEKRRQELFSDSQFWQIIDSLDWSKKNSEEVLKPAVEKLAEMPVVNIYLFEDKLAEKLQQLDTRQHGDAYLAHEKDDYLSVDDFLYVRCAVIAEGQSFYEKILTTPSDFPTDISFEPLLSLASKAYQLSTGREFNYHSPISYETYSNKEGWK